MCNKPKFQQYKIIQNTENLKKYYAYRKKHGHYVINCLIRKQLMYERCMRLGHVKKGCERTEKIIYEHLFLL